MDLSTYIGTTNIKIPIYNASGVYCTEKEELQNLYNLKYTGAVITKSCTKNERDGNPFPRYWSNKKNNISINSSGLPNYGFDYYSEWIKFCNKDKPVILSYAPLSQEELIHTVKQISKSDWITDIEYNMSCPNITTNQQIGYDFESLSYYLRIINENSIQKNVGIKLPPYFDNTHIQTVSNIINQYQNINFITCINSIGNGLIINSKKEETYIKPNNGLGGLGGDICLPVALSNVYQFNKLLKNKSIIGCGGIKSGDDVFQHILAGASAVQIGTHLYNNGPTIFKKILSEFKSIMKKKKYNNIYEFRGKLKTITNNNITSNYKYKKLN